jgi:predicted nucleotidyltransferase
MLRPALPAPVATLATDLAGLPGAVAVVLGGSRATATHRPDSDWDLGVYYRGSQRPLDPDDVRRLRHRGHVSELGEWGPIVNGGAWLTIDGTPVDVLFRDLDTVESWLSEAQEGRFEVLSQNGYIVGAPTYLPVGELALCRPIAGELPRPGFPEPLAAAAATRWAGRAQVSLMFAQAHAEAGDVVPARGCSPRLPCALPTDDSRSAASGCSTRSVWFGAPVSTICRPRSPARAPRPPSWLQASYPSARLWASSR